MKNEFFGDNFMRLIELYQNEEERRLLIKKAEKRKKKK